MDYIDFMKSGGIHIKKKNKGKFTESAKRAGKSVQEHADDVLDDPNATRMQKRRAQFAKNAKKWQHEEGGILLEQTGGKALATGISAFKEDPKEEEKEEKTEEKDEKEGTTTTSTSTTTTSDDPYAWTKAKISSYTGLQDGKLVTPEYKLETKANIPTSSSYKDVVEYLTSKGFTREAAAGVAGVFMAESGLKAGITNKEEDALYGSTAGRGLGQWSNERRRQYDDYMKDKEISLQNDLDFFIQDLESRPLVKQALQNALSVEDAVKAMHLGYENGSSGAMATPEQLTATYTKAWKKAGYGPYSYKDSHDKRYKFAQQAYNS